MDSPQFSGVSCQLSNKFFVKHFFAKNEIVAPRIYVYDRPGNGSDWKGGQINDPETAKRWVKYAKKKGIDGLKLTSPRPQIMKALLDE